MMKKRGQITIFILMVIVILIALFFVFYARSSVIKTKSAPAIEKTSKSEFEIVPIKTYIESCLKKSAEKAFFDRIGLQGGYISPSGYELSKYYDKGASEVYTGTGDALANYDNYEVPFYLDGTQASILPKEQVEKKSAKYIFVEFLECTNFTTFNEIGFDIKAQDTNNILSYLKSDFGNSVFTVKVNINKNDVSVKLTYPITIKKEGFKAEISDFLVTLPIAIGDIYDNSNKLINNIKENGQIPNQYDITKDCQLYNVNDLTNIYYRPLSKDSGVIQFVDFSTYYHNYIQSFIFQFAVKNVNVTGACVG